MHRHKAGQSSPATAQTHKHIDAKAEKTAETRGMGRPTPKKALVEERLRPVEAHIGVIHAPKRLCLRLMLLLKVRRG